MEGICFSPCSLKLTTVDRQYLRWVIVLARDDVEVHLHASQTTTEHFRLCVWWNVILKNCNIFRKQHMNHRIHLATSNAHIVTGSNSTIQSKYRTSRLLDIAAQIITDLVPCFSWNQASRIIGFLGWGPNINLTWCWEQWEGWLIWPYYVFPVIRGLAIAALPWMLDFWSSH